MGVGIIKEDTTASDTWTRGSGEFTITQAMGGADGQVTGRARRRRSERLG